MSNNILILIYKINIPTMHVYERKNVISLCFDFFYIVLK